MLQPTLCIKAIKNKFAFSKDFPYIKLQPNRQARKTGQEMNAITSDAIKALAADKSNIEMSSYANSRCIKRIICSEDILNVLRNGEIIE